MQKNIKIIETYISDIKKGDTVIIDGKLTTVGKNDIKIGGFMGSSLFGISYPKKVSKVLFVVPTIKGVVLR